MSGPLPYRNLRTDNLDPHIDDGRGPMPRVPPGYQKPSKKVQGRIVWPRDKNRGTWGRIKDLMTGKGPDMYYSRSDQFAPTKATWSNWTEPWYDSLGYRDEHDMHQACGRMSKKYDFRTRRYVSNYMDKKVWSDVKWEPGKNPDMPMYWRDAYGNEYTQRVGFIPAAWQSPQDRMYAQGHNDFRYDPNGNGWEWTHPKHHRFWKQQ